ncbi:UNVERIFIED_CONTAM: hypothetical protein HDU68_011047 [Siphonaria sp. JEL0065]|nr:hypothetical protein HDU68_011047 [Siphonaria sp. JEL0065]
MAKLLSILSIISAATVAVGIPVFDNNFLNLFDEGDDQGQIPTWETHAVAPVAPQTVATQQQQKSKAVVVAPKTAPLPPAVVQGVAPTATGAIGNAGHHF